MNNKDVGILKRGLKCMGLALFTAALFAISVWGFITVATAPGYLAVLLFIGSLMVLGIALLFTYAQGLIGVVHEESQGDEE